MNSAVSSLGRKMRHMAKKSRHPGAQNSQNPGSSAHVQAGYQALHAAAWTKARRAFETALALEETPEALEADCSLPLTASTRLPAAPWRMPWTFLSSVARCSMRRGPGQNWPARYQHSGSTMPRLLRPVRRLLPSKLWGLAVMPNEPRHCWATSLHRMTRLRPASLRA
jgi:hypothetical protein